MVKKFDNKVLQSYVCVGCSAVFQRIPCRDYKYCSHACYLGKQKGRTNNPSIVPSYECLWCGEQFYGTKSAGSKRLYCSRSCQHLGNCRDESINQLRPTDAAYMAAMIDGEGHISVRFRHKDHSNCSRPSVFLGITNTYIPLMDWLIKTTGAGKMYRNCAGHNKPCFTWKTGTRAAVVILSQVLPYMIEKKSRAEAAIASQPPEVFLRTSIAKRPNSAPLTQGQAVQLSML